MQRIRRGSSRPLELPDQYRPRPVRGDEVRRTQPPRTITSAGLAVLQRLAGNRAVREVVQREDGDGGTATVTIPDAPSSTAGVAGTDHYRQTWTVGTRTYIFSSGHGFRPVHKPGGPDITAQGVTMNAIERAILADLDPAVVSDTIAVAGQGERPVTVSGVGIAYRYKRFSSDKIGVGTYFMP